jgi:alkanesulfonate monooxygenase SsuD/methylene tetrahydromethanopterin reductase-like flavin-dependent oxidoreductase (luciferase family)
MLLGLQLFSFAWPHHQAQLGDTLGLIAQRAERAGLYSFWMPDHFFQVPAFGRMEDPMLEGWSTLAFVAGSAKSPGTSSTSLPRMSRARCVSRTKA